MAIVIFPTHSIHLVNAFPTLISFAFHPVSIEVGEQPIDIARASSVSVPFRGIVS